ncbi:hypothetical protein H7S74_30255 [Priestia aryabhattai]|uniref:hypothetical protein n=1 Tax=Priestia aryabhattai TaxID=412384 RepID=UPI001EC5B7CA|nr:hypothetical protein [Priestia aryabhattai]MBY0094934.1 hypothetical protein [Priestia aryabhattai]MBY0105578.1 hypothetical protein [Priestia aryabhattai]
MAKVQKPKFNANVIDVSVVRARDCYEVKVLLSTSFTDVPIEVEHIIDDLEDLDKVIELLNKYSN